MEPKSKKLFEEGKSLLNCGDSKNAVLFLANADELSPNSPHILEQLAKAHTRNGDYIPALKAYDRIIELNAATAEIWLSTGNALSDVGEYAQAIGAYENSLKLDNDNPETHHNLARVLYRMGQTSRAASHLESGLKHGDSIESWQSLATLIPAWPEADHLKLLKTRTVFARKLAEYYGKPWPTERDRPRPRPHDGPLRIGFICAFFHNANYTKPVWGLINHLNRSEFQICLFSDSPDDAGMPCYQPQATDQLYDIRDLDNEQVTALIRSTGIDILVDLNAYSYEGRLGLFLGYPAPVNVAWWNMYASSGLPGIEFIVGDDEMIQPDELQHFSESVLCLPVSYLTFTVDYPVPPVSELPQLTEGCFTFGNLAPQYKITPQVLDAWAEILRRAPGSRLLLANRTLKSPNNQAYVREQFKKRGIDRDRVDLYGPSDHVTYLRHYDKIDLALDTFPYNGGTSTMEAIWQGVPVLTIDGDRWVSRTSQTLLRRCHLDRFVATDVDDMIERGLQWACHSEAHDELAVLRQQMRKTLVASSACDTAALARGMERLFREIWGRALRRDQVRDT